MNNLLQVLFASVKAKITPLVTKIKLWTSWNFIKTRLVSSVRTFLVNLFDVKPKHKKDYYEIFGWLVSKRLAFAIVVVVGVFSVYYLVSARMAVTSTATGDTVKTYSYNSVMLRLAKGQVRIKGKSGYLAYEGEVEKGYVTGNGRLYNPQGTLLYQGSFEKNEFEGMGTQYYPTGSMEYQGEFSHNLYEGNGKQYRENGSVWYDGSFAQGKKEGTGILYDNASSPVYEGNFLADELVYSEFIGKSTQDAAKCYSGERQLYESTNEFVVYMEDIDAMYVGDSNSNALDDEMKIGSIYVLKDAFRTGNSMTSSIEELKNTYFGEADFEGNSDVTMAEAVCINKIAEYSQKAGKPVEMDTSASFDDYTLVNSYDDMRAVYLYSFHKDGLIYTFVANDRDDTFVFYYIEKEEGGSDS